MIANKKDKINDKNTELSYGLNFSRTTPNKTIGNVLPVVTFKQHFLRGIALPLLDTALRKQNNALKTCNF